MILTALFFACNSEFIGSFEGYTDGESYYVLLEADPAPIPFNEYFDVDISVFTDDSKSEQVDDLSVELNANMPAHGHGMNEMPIMTGPSNGVFTAEGLKWFMEGEWELTAYIRGEKNENISFLVECCSE